MKPLLNFTDTRYLRRLVREINNTPDGCYWQGTRCNRARLQNSQPDCIATFQLRNAASGNWFTPTVIDNIIDVYGRNICASRVP